LISAQELAGRMTQTPHMMGKDMQYGGSLLLRVPGVKNKTLGAEATAALEKVEGVAKATFYPQQKAVGIQFRPKGKVTSQQLIKALENAGFKAGQYGGKVKTSSLNNNREDNKSGIFTGGTWRTGEALFRQNCASCHGPNLKGHCMAPSLVGVTGHMTDTAIVAHARKIGETMCCARHIRHLSDRDFADIVAFFHAVDNDPAVRRRLKGATSGSGCCCFR
jgi:mono/diheme cytochrome c family protein